MCVSACPTNAIEMNLNSSEKIIKTIEAFSKFNKSPKIIAFCCQSCGYAAADDAGLKRILYSPNIFIISVPCAGRVDSEFILKSFEMGFDGVMVIGCRKDSCRYYDGIEKVNKKILILKGIIGPKLTKRITLKRINSVEGHKFARISNNIYQFILEEMKNET